MGQAALQIALREDQVEALKRWLEARQAGVPGWEECPALGRSYVARRRRGGSAYHACRAYVQLDHATARLVPELAGRSGAEIEALINKTAG